MTIRRWIRVLSLVAGLAFTETAVTAQTTRSENAADSVDSKPREGGDAAESAVDVLLKQALRHAENGEWNLALNALDEAEAIDATDPRIASYRASVKELRAVDAAQNAWAEGEPADFKPADPPDDAESKDTVPRFVIDRGEDGERTNPGRYRDRLRIDLALKFFALDPIINDLVNTWSSVDEVLYSSLNFDLRYWFPFLRRSFGFYFGSNGYSWRPGQPTILLNALDLGANFRGFLLESIRSRMEFGIDFGASLHSENMVGSGEIQRNAALFLGLWIKDPVLYHVFNAEPLENLIFAGGVRIYTAGGVEELIETLNYRIEGAWHFGKGRIGVRFEWWDFAMSGTRKSIFSLSLVGGFGY